jgi:iron complex outermembrane recepter protein
MGKRQDIIWGAGYRHIVDDTVGTLDQAFVPADSAGHFFNLFLQDQITLRPNRAYLYVKTKLENSYFTGFDLQQDLSNRERSSRRRTCAT